MYSKATRFENRAAWLGSPGILLFLMAVVPQLNTGYAAAALSGIQIYAAVMLAFAGVIHWGRAMNTGNPRLLSLSVAPSLLAWLALFMTPGYALPILIVGFLVLFIFDYRQYRGHRLVPATAHIPDRIGLRTADPKFA